MASRELLISRALNGDFDAVDALVKEGVVALDDVLEAMVRADVSTQDTLGNVARRIAGRDVSGSIARFLNADVSLDAFTAAVDVLARSGDPHGYLSRFAETPDELETLRGIAILGLGQTHEPQYAPQIRKIASKAEAEGELMLLGDCIEALTALGDHSLDPKVVELLKNRKVEVKLRAARILPYLFFAGLIKLLQTAARHRSAEIRRYAIDAFYYLGTKSAAGELEKLTRDRDARTRQNAVARLAMVTGSDIDEGDVDKARKIVSKLSDDFCYRDGEPIDLAKLAEKASTPGRRLVIAEELRVETGQSFDFNPSREDGDPEALERIRAWVKRNAGRFEIGACYKFGFHQDLPLSA
jgi:HEAT repeat protein